MRGRGGLAGLVRNNTYEYVSTREGRVGLSVVRVLSFVLKYIVGPVIVAVAIVRVARRFPVVIGVIAPRLPLSLVLVIDLRSSVLPVRGSTEELVAEDDALL